MADFTKERKEVDTKTVDFADRLDSGDSVSSLTSITITQQTSSGYKDVSSEFGSPTGTLSGDTVDLDLGAAASGDQDAGSNYIIRVEVDTTDGETLIATPTLRVTAEGDPDAP